MFRTFYGRFLSAARVLFHVELAMLVPVLRLPSTSPIDKHTASRQGMDGQTKAMPWPPGPGTSTFGT